MYTLQVISVITLLVCSILGSVFSQSKDKISTLDVMSYEAVLELNIEKEQIEGSVDIAFQTDAATVAFNSGKLQIIKVAGENVLSYECKDQKIIISLRDRKDPENRIQIIYKGNPTVGMFFIHETEEIYTAFSTSEWMICNNSPSDRAKFKLDIIIPSDKICVASGTLVQKMDQGDKIKYSWVQDYQTPTYTYGFAVGDFKEYQEMHRDISLNYYAANYSAKDVETIFDKTSDMMDFLEERSGIRYVQNSYSQILIGNHYQEMAGLAVLKNSYGELVLKDTTETNLISHELAHQWWGNMITCENWNHFWLNEGFATFMSAAYNGHRFGQRKYDSDINSYFEVYNSIKNSGKDKPLVFTDWSNPSRDDRNLVYFKGAYVLHLLRTELGEEGFWNGIKYYSQKYFGKSVNTLDFQKSMEASSGKNLNAFFHEWIY